MEHGALDLDQRVRLAAFDFLAQQTQLTSDGVPSRTLEASGVTLDSICFFRID